MTARRWWSSLGLRMRTLFRKKHVERELDEELQFHLDRQVEVLMERGLSAKDARRAALKEMGGMGMERQMEKCRDVRAWQWMEILRADVKFGWMQLMKRKVTTLAAILSLGLAIGSCVAAFRLVDALFLQPMPVSNPGSLYEVFYNGFNFVTGEPRVTDGNSYALFQQMRESVKGQAELIVAGDVTHADLTFGTYQEMEQANVEAVSGELFPKLGLKPELGRLFNEGDDRAPGASPYAVLSYDYWERRFGSDPRIVGRTFRMGEQQYEIVGVAQRGFVGTQPGKAVDFFIPVMMETELVKSAGDFALRVFVRPAPGVAVETLQSRLYAVYRTSEKERAKGFVDFPKNLLDGYPHEQLKLRRASGGASALQKDYGSPLIALSVLVGMVLLIACANVANLMSAQAAARGREMALRMSLGSGRVPLIRLVLVESAMLGLMAAAVGTLFAWWAAPFVMKRMSAPGDPVQLMLRMNWTVLGFGLALAMVVALLFGLIPAMRASGVKPVNALKGGDEPHARGRLMHGLIAAQVAFCFVVLFVAGLFQMTFKNLENKPLGFSAERVLLLETVAEQPQAPAKWDALLQRVRSTPGVTSVAMSDWALASGSSENNFITVPGKEESRVLTFLLNISPGWIAAMRIPMLDGRDFRDSDMNANTAIVNEAFAKQYFGGQNPVGKTFQQMGSNVPISIVGLIGDAAYRRLREPTLPQAYQPMRASDGKGGVKGIRFGIIAVRTENNDPLVLAETLRKTIAQTDPIFRVRNTQTQKELVDTQTIRERMLATLGGFFALVALLLAGIGLYGVLHHSVLQREREFGIRIAIGASIRNIARLATTEVFVMVLAGAAAGVVLGMASTRYVLTLLYGVKATDASTMLLPMVALLFVALLAAAPVVFRAARIDPAIMLRAE